MKTKKIWPIILIVIIIATAAGVIIFNSTDTARFRKQLNLGQRYLSEMNYEEAVVAFNQAIEIDPRNADAYLGLADAYLGLGDEEAALAALEKGYEATGDERLKARIDEMMTNREAAAKMQEETVHQEEREETEIHGQVVTGTVQMMEDYFDTEPQPGDGWTWYCLVFEEPQNFTVEGETYTVSVLNISNGGDAAVDTFEGIVGEKVTVDIEVDFSSNTNPMTRSGNPLWAFVWNILEEEEQ